MKKVAHYNNELALAIIAVFNQHSSNEFYSPINGKLINPMGKYPSGTSVRVDYEMANPEDLFFVTVSIADGEQEVESFIEEPRGHALTSALDLINNGIE